MFFSKKYNYPPVYVYNLSFYYNKNPLLKIVKEQKKFNSNFNFRLQYLQLKSFNKSKYEFKKKVYSYRVVNNTKRCIFILHFNKDF